MERTIDAVWHEGRQWVTVQSAAELAKLSEAAIYKAIRLGQLESAEILGVKSVPVTAVRERWPLAEVQA